MIRRPPRSTLFPHDALPISAPAVRDLHQLQEPRSLPVDRGADAHHLGGVQRSEEHTSELQSQSNLVCRLLLEKKKKRRATGHLYQRYDVQQSSAPVALTDIR